MSTLQARMIAAASHSTLWKISGIAPSSTASSAGGETSLPIERNHFSRATKPCGNRHPVSVASRGAPMKQIALSFALALVLAAGAMGLISAVKADCPGGCATPIVVADCQSAQPE
jgi:hypothetical protein